MKDLTTSSLTTQASLYRPHPLTEESSTASILKVSRFEDEVR